VVQARQAQLARTLALHEKNNFETRFRILEDVFTIRQVSSPMQAELPTARMPFKVYEFFFRWIANSCSAVSPGMQSDIVPAHRGFAVDFPRDESNEIEPAS